MIKGKVTRPAYSDGDGELILTATLTAPNGEEEVIEFKSTVRKVGMTDTQSVAADKKELDLNIVLSAVTEDILLPTIGDNGSRISWVSDKEAIISNTGKVNRPENGTGNETVILTATITKGSVTDTKAFTLTVLQWTDEEECQFDLDAITWDSIKGANSSKATVISDLQLPSVGAKGSSITWVSNNISVLDIDGTVTRPSYTNGDVIVAISATVTKGNVTKTVSITNIKVLKLTITNKEAVEKAVNELDSVSFLGNNNSLSEIVDNMVLPISSNSTDCSSVSFSWTVVKSDGTTVDTNNKYVQVNNTGNSFECIITRPDSTTGNIDLNLKVEATSVALTGGTATASKVFAIVVLATP